ncbi:ABC transporter ATP-binding protein [Devosia soli]|uniref:ABC transporter ATP-binding protein n=1 Tax=Devosia soli TaxID=361041 RepID=A0A0F5L1I9_9HYPH|nr:ABC transporter ATP-binding protein [Devosia soli]KKB76064.1 ABC transporter ATP-binding protein [Devosia soli]
MAKTEWTTSWPALRAIFRSFWKKSHWMLIAIGGVTLVSALFSIATPYVFSRLIDELADGTIVSAVFAGFVGYAAIRGFEMLFGRATSYLSFMVSENLKFIAATAFFAKLLRKPGTFFIEHNPVAIQTARAQGESAVQSLAQLALIVFVPGIAQIGFSIALLGAIISIELMVIVGVYGICFVALTYFANRWTKPLLDQAIEANQENSRFVGNAVNAMETIRYFNGDRWISEKFAEKAELARSSWVRWSWRHIALSGIFGLALALQLGFTYFVMLPRFAAGEMSLGDLVLINLVLTQLNRPFEMIGSAIDDIFRSISRFQPFAAMWAEPDDRAGHGSQILDPVAGSITFDNVGFRYGDRRTLKAVSFSVPAGGTAFITGPTGAGKTTLFRLALKSLEPTEGRILVDGVDLEEIDRASWYDLVGVVPQDVMLLNDTLATNIVLGRQYDARRLRHAAERASILSFIENQPDGFETTVGERGLKLSGGERQRVSIARALYGDPKVLFLDEASSALDETTEGQIMAELRGLEDVTILAITHRRSIIAPGDQVIALDFAEHVGEAASEPASSP